VPVRLDTSEVVPLSLLPVEKSSATRRAFFISHMVQEPFIALYSMLAILLTKQLNATPFQIAVLTMLKPMVSVLSFYWGSFLLKKRFYLKENLLVATSFSVIPFIFAPMIDHAWFFVIAGASYAFFSKAAIPARMELLKINTSEGEKEHLFSKASCIAYAIGVVASLCFGIVLDAHPEWWRQLVCVAGAISLLSVIALSLLPDDEAVKSTSIPLSESNVKDTLLHPWQETFRLLKSRPDFLHFQVGFFLAGLGLMIAMPAIPSFLSDLDISYIELFLSIGVIKGLGFILTSTLWASAIRRFPLPLVSAAVFCGFGLFLASLLLAIFDPRFVLAAYGIYGIAQAGSHLIWHLSGPIFSGKETSFQYSSVNILAIGLRGMIGPLLGGLITQFLSPEIAIATGAGIGSFAVWYMISRRVCLPAQKR
jgi:MFS family permease